jgi:hypothetical protein
MRDDIYLLETEMNCIRNLLCQLEGREDVHITVNGMNLRDYHICQATFNHIRKAIQESLERDYQYLQDEKERWYGC